MTERELAACIEDACKLYGWRYYHNVPTRRDYPHVTSKGFPDYVLVRGKRVLFRELKGPWGVVSPSQDIWLGALQVAGQDADVWHPEDWPDRILSELR